MKRRSGLSYDDQRGIIRALAREDPMRIVATLRALGRARGVTAERERVAAWAWDVPEWAAASTARRRRAGLAAADKFRERCNDPPAPDPDTLATRSRAERDAAAAKLCGPAPPRPRKPALDDYLALPASGRAEALRLDTIRWWARAARRRWRRLRKRLRDPMSTTEMT